MSTEPTWDDPQYRCENCGTVPLQKFVIPECTTMWYCRHCGLYQKGRVPDLDAYGLAYHDIYEPYRQRKLRTAAVRLNRIASLLENRRLKLLDVGCSLGATVEAAVGRGWDACGVDVSEEAVNYCRDRCLRCISTQGLELPFPDATFDVVTAWHVIEHVPDVTEALAHWRRVLKPGGLLVIETPDTACPKVRLLSTRYKKYWKAEHVYAFNRSNLKPFLHRAAFELLPAPLCGRLGDLNASMAIYVVLYQSTIGAKRMLGIHKAFQVFCRRTPHDDGAVRLRFAA